MKSEEKRNYVHGMSATPIYRVWQAMINRCENPNVKSYPRYGGRGIKVCKSWHEFKNFYADMGNRPERGTLERIDNDGDYEPSNVKWQTRHTQSRNKSNNHFLILNGQKKVLSDWAKELQITPNAILKRIKRGMTEEQALLTPKPRNNYKPNARFNDEQIKQIRSEFRHTSATKLGKMYGVSKTSILNICSFKTYTNIF